MSPRRAAGPLEPGDVIDRYEVLAEIGRGGMGVVYAVRRGNVEGFAKLLALKMLHDHFVADAGVVSMFLDEARIASHIDHPNVVQVLDVAEGDGRPYLVMELLAGRSLADILLRAEELERPVPLSLRLLVLAQAAAGLHAAHSATNAEREPLGVVHRDVTPHNIHVGYSGVTKLIDFGIAATRDRISRTRTGEVKGTLAYLAPEQVTLARALTARADIWALGVVAWEALSGQRLFKAANDAATMFAVMNKRVPDLHALGVDVPEDVSRVVAACLSREIDRRPASCEEVARRLQAASAIGDGGAELGKLVRALFAREKADEEERLAMAMRRPRAAVSRAASSPSWRTPAVAGVVALAAAGLGVAAWADIARQPAAVAEAATEPPAALPDEGAGPTPAATPSAPIAEPAADVADDEAVPSATPPPRERAPRPPARAPAGRAAAAKDRPAPSSSPLLASPYGKKP